MAKVTLKGSSIHTNGDLPAKGSKAPNFHLVDQDLGEKSLKDFAGKRKVLFTVPSIDTGVCSTSAKKLNTFAKEHTQFFFLVASADLPFALKRFCAAEGAKNIVTLSMMRSKDFAKDYGILIQDGPLAGICARSVLVFDEHDKVLYTELVPEITHEPDYDKAFHALLAKA